MGVLKSLGDLYVAKHVAVHRPAGSLEFFAAETQKYHDELQDAESKLRSFGLQKCRGGARPAENRFIDPGGGFRWAFAFGGAVGRCGRRSA